jgi:hypothetical protein
LLQKGIQLFKLLEEHEAQCGNGRGPRL